VIIPLSEKKNDNYICLENSKEKQDNLSEPKPESSSQQKYSTFRVALAFTQPSTQQGLVAIISWT
jgi:hypothetical protein